MERAEKQGLAVAAVAHVALFAALSLSLFSARIPRPPVADTMDVQLVKDVGLRSAAPKVAQEAPAPSQAPEQGPPTEAAPPPPAPVPEPQPKPVPPKPAPAKPTPPKPQPRPEPRPEPKPQPKPEKPQPKTKPAPEKPAPATKPEAKPQKQQDRLPANFLKSLSKDLKGKPDARPKGSLLGKDFLKGISPDKAPGKADAPHAAAVSARSMAGLGALIRQQVKPNYNPPTGGADAASIVTTLHITMARDGSVSGVEVVGHQGVNGSNSAYVRQADEAAIRAVRRSSPLRLPPDLYEGGWQDITLNFRPDQMQ